MLRHAAKKRMEDSKNKLSDKQRLLKARVFATNLLASLPTELSAAGFTSESKLPFKAASFRELLMHRMADLSLVAVDLYECNKIIPAFIITRAALETLAILFVFHKKLSQFIESKDSTQLDEFLNKAMLGSRDSSSHLDSYNVLTAIDHIDKKFSGFREQYERLCEFSHPNWLGVLASYGRIDRETITLRLGEGGRKPPRVVGLGTLLQSLKIFEHYYNELAELLQKFNDYYENQKQS